MILKLYRSKSDIENLSKVRTANTPSWNWRNYKKIVVNKPWGYEYLMYENKQVAVWVLFLNSGQRTSMHCHPNKKSSLIVVSGKITLVTLEGEYSLTKGDGLIIGEGVFHSSLSKSRNGSFLLEIESPPIKRDLVRLKDEYGRESQGYEGRDQMSRNLSGYDYVDFHRDRDKKILRTCHLSIHSSDNFEFNHLARDRDVFCLLTGAIELENDQEFLSCGEIIHAGDLKSLSTFRIADKLMWLLVGTHGKKSKQDQII